MARAREAAIRIAITIACGLLSQIAHGQSLPAGILDCTRIHDALMRLECFDRAVASYQSLAATPQAPPAVAATLRPEADGAKTAAPATSAGPVRHLKAKIVRVKPSYDDVRVTLDNGQIWEQTQAAPAALDLHVGATIAIDRSLGSYWLSDATGASMKVKEIR